MPGAHFAANLDGRQRAADVAACGPTADAAIEASRHLDLSPEQIRLNTPPTYKSHRYLYFAHALGRQGRLRPSGRGLCKLPIALKGRAALAAINPLAAVLAPMNITMAPLKK